MNKLSSRLGNAFSGLSLIIALVYFFTLGGAAWGGAVAVPLQLIEQENFSGFEPQSRDLAKASFKEKSFSLKEAINLKEMEALLGPFSEAQKDYLEKNRFLLLPKPKFIFASPEENSPADEMLFNFDGLGGRLKESLRQAENARFINSDIMLHALKRYTANRQEALEAGILREISIQMLKNLMANAAHLKKNSSYAAESWERLMGQLLVPLILLENCSGADDSAGEEAINSLPGQDASESKALRLGNAPSGQGRAGDNFENAMLIFDKHRSKFSNEAIRNIRGELRRIYRAEAKEISLLGLKPIDGGNLIDYSRFKAKGHYERLSASRAYYRAMIWLKETGWDSQDKEAVADALNFALAMSYIADEKSTEGGLNKDNVLDKINNNHLTKPPDELNNSRHNSDSRPFDALENPLKAWARLVAISSFFQGPAGGYSYQQWLAFLMKEAGVPEFTADTAADKEVIARLVESRLGLASKESMAQSTVISMLPHSQALAEATAEYFSRGGGEKESLPPMFSFLWLPSMWGNKAAIKMLPRQVGLAVSGAGQDEKAEDSTEQSRVLMSFLDGAAKWWSSAEVDNFYTLPVASFKIMRVLSSEFSSGYPLYMRSEAFKVKRIETVAGFFTDMAHDTPSLPASLAAALAPKSKNEKNEKEKMPPVVKGFVEPDLMFWSGLIDLLSYIESFYKKYSLFPEDLEQLGALRRFSKRVERCYELAEKELKGEDLTDDDYEFIRLFSLDWLTLPPGDVGGPRLVGQLRSAVVRDIRTVQSLLDDGQGVLIYEATGEPRLMLVLVGNEKSPRLVLGLAYNHYEFAGLQSRLIKDEDWGEMAYHHYSQGPYPEGLRAPSKNFWYDALQP